MCNRLLKLDGGLQLIKHFSTKLLIFYMLYKYQLLDFYDLIEACYIYNCFYHLHVSAYPFVPVMLYFGLQTTMRRVIREWMYYDVYATVVKCATIYLMHQNFVYCKCLLYWIERTFSFLQKFHFKGKIC